jgi:hypothetical protein
MSSLYFQIHIYRQIIISSVNTALQVIHVHGITFFSFLTDCFYIVFFADRFKKEKKVINWKNKMLIANGNQ